MAYLEPHTFTYKCSPNGLKMSAPEGKVFEAEFDGKDYPVKGAPAGTTVALAKYCPVIWR